MKRKTRRSIQLIICLSIILIGILITPVWVVCITSDAHLNDLLSWSISVILFCIMLIAFFILLCNILYLTKIWDNYEDISEEIEIAHMVRMKPKGLRRLIHRLYHITKNGGSTCGTCSQREQCRGMNIHESKYANNKCCY